MLNGTRVVVRLLLGFGIALLGALLVGGVAERSIARLSDIATDIFEHPFTVTSSILDVKGQVLFAQKLMTTMVHNAEPAEVEHYRTKIMAQWQRVDKDMAKVRQGFLGSQDEIDQIDRALLEWRTAREETIAAAKAGRRAEAIALNDGRDARLGDDVLKEIQDVVSFAADKAQAFRANAEHEASATRQTLLALVALTLASGLAAAFLVTLSINRSLRELADAVKGLAAGSEQKVQLAEAIASGDLSRDIARTEVLKIDLDSLPNDEIGTLMKAAADLSAIQLALGDALQRMTKSLRVARDTEREIVWFKTGQNELGALMRGEQKTLEMANRVLSYLAEYLKAGVGALYLIDEQSGDLQLTASYAFTRRKNLGDRFRLGEGLIGEAARERKPICLSHVPDDYIAIASALGESAPKMVAAFPLLHGDQLVGAIELGAFREFNDSELDFLRAGSESIAIGFNGNLSRQRMAELLEVTQQQAEELRVQQEELQQSNEELEERAQMLEQQREQIRLKNRDIESASDALRQKAEDLERISTYKSEFLANMSHELRTPLNSLMILSSLLAQNKEQNLTPKQVEFASTINGAGRDLLNLINDILDLAKVESGQMNFDCAEVPVAPLVAALHALFDPVAEQKALAFNVRAHHGVPEAFAGDEQRIQQILKNLLSNAFKFTESGTVDCDIRLAEGKDNPLDEPAIAFAVSDSGIGIASDKQQQIFHAFQQADGSVSRKYGGTGLGLSISLQLAGRMGGDIRLTSLPGSGSCFTLYLPLKQRQAAAHGQTPGPKPAVAPAAVPTATVSAQPVPEAGSLSASPIPDDREIIAAGERSILVIEDDLGFARLLLDMVRERDFAALCANDGETGIALAEQYLPSAVILDVMLPNTDGWTVMRRLKDNPRTRHIPVHFITCMEDRQKALAMGAIGFETKPVSPEQLSSVFANIESAVSKSVKRLLIVEDNLVEAQSMVALMEAQGVDITVAATGKDAIAHLSNHRFDCMVLDLGLSDMSGFDLLEHIQAMEDARRIPVIIHSGRELSRDDEKKLRNFAESIIIKGALSAERLLNEVSLFLHLVETNLHPNKQRMIRASIDKEAMMAGRKVLLVDDDMRNVFSLTSVLAEKDITVIEAENGRIALSRLEEHPDISLVLMDIMMPEMDGYTAIREIRKNPRTRSVPVIAMTAKALKGDQEKCLAAGASDYISKPIDVDKLMSLIRVWIYQRS